MLIPSIISDGSFRRPQPSFPFILTRKADSVESTLALSQGLMSFLMGQSVMSFHVILRFIKFTRYWKIITN